MTISDTLKAKIDELEIERHVTEAVASLERAVITGVEKAGDYVHTNNDKIAGLLDKAVATVDGKTEGKYADQVAKVRGFVDAGIGKLAEQRHDVTETVTDTWHDATDSGSGTHPTA